MKNIPMKQVALYRKLGREQGFTLVELIVTMAIAAIILMQGIPSFATFIKNNRLITATNDLVADINLARSEAITRGIPVVLCSSADPAAGTACGGTWTSGWLVYADVDSDSAFDPAVDTLIRIGQAATGSVGIDANAAGTNNLIYSSNGMTGEGGNTVSFAICDDRGVDYGRQIDVNSTGRPRLTSGSIAACTI